MTDQRVSALPSLEFDEPKGILQIPLTPIAVLVEQNLASGADTEEAFSVALEQHSAEIHDRFAALHCYLRTKRSPGNGLVIPMSLHGALRSLPAFHFDSLPKFKIVSEKQPEHGRPKKWPLSTETLLAAWMNKLIADGNKASQAAGLLSREEPWRSWRTSRAREDRHLSAAAIERRYRELVKRDPQFADVTFLDAFGADVDPELSKFGK